MAVNCGRLITETIGELQSWSLDSEQATTLSGPMGVADVSFNVTTARGVATGVSPGIIEVDQELMYCDTVNQSGAVTVVPWGRGYMGTTATTHAAGTRVVSQPQFPRYWVMQKLNEVMERIFPMVFAVRTVDTTTTLPRVTYTMNSDFEWVLDARWQVPDGRNYWQAVKRWRAAPTGPGGITLDIADPMVPGRPLHIEYAAKPGLFTSEADDFETVTGLNLGLRDVLVLGAAAALTAPEELSRLQMSSIEQQNRAQLVAPSAGLTASNALEARFQKRLMEERRSLQRLYPPRITGTWI